MVAITKPLGVITSDGVSLAEIENFERIRVFSMALSSKDGRDRGRPSSWSSTLDSLAVDYMGDTLAPRLFTVCAGNTGEQLNDLMEYPNHNELQDIHDPSQAWNILTVGAATFKSRITESSSYTALAKIGSLSPYSTTSTLWDRSRPIKPEVVFEGGNVGMDAFSCIGLPSLKLLTTNNDISQRSFTTSEATSAATALAARFAAQLYVQYPDYWPETIRAIMVHSAEWTSEMLNLVRAETTLKRKASRLVRLVGFGLPNLEKALWSTNNSLSLVVQDTIRPYQRKKGGNPSYKDMNIHNLPWPKSDLLALGEIEVEMTVTLSYFIEPNPSSRNVAGRYSYPSHQLRFEVKRPSESVKEFRSRLSKAARSEEEDYSQTSSSDSNWVFGEFRHKGSLHKDTWKGTAAELAERGQIAIYPAMGWWRTRTSLRQWNKDARYALIASIKVPETDVEIEVDLYASIMTLLESKTTVATRNNDARSSS